MASLVFQSWLLQSLESSSFLTLSLPPLDSICQTLNVCWNSPTPRLGIPYLFTASAFLPTVSTTENSLTPTAFVCGTHSHLVLHFKCTLLWEIFLKFPSIASGLVLIWTNLTFWYFFPVQSFMHLFSEHLLRTSSGQSQELGAGDLEINRTWLLSCRRPHSSWGDGNWNRQF